MQSGLISNLKGSTKDTQASAGVVGNDVEGASNSTSQQRTETSKGKKVEWIMFALFVFIFPLFVLPFTLSSIAFSKQLLAGVFILGMFIYALGKFLGNGKITLPSKFHLLSIGVFFLLILMSTGLSKHTSGSLLGITPDSFFWVVMYVLGFFLSLTFLNSKKAVNWTAMAFIFSAGLTTIFALLHFSGVPVLPNVFGGNINFNPVGSVLDLGFLVAGAFVALIGFLSLVKLKDIKVKVGLWLLVGLFALFLVQLNQSEVLTALIVALAFIAPILLATNLKAEKGKFSSSSSVLVPVIMSVAFLMLFVGTGLPSTMTISDEIRPSADATYSISRDSLSGLRFLSGTGPSTFAYNYTEHRPIEVNQTNFWGVQFDQGYSAVLTYASTWGVLGLLAFLSAIGLFLTTLFTGSMKMLKITDNNDDSNILKGVVLGSFAAFIVFVAAMFLYAGNVVLHMFVFLSAGVALSALHLLGMKQKRNVVMTASPQIMATTSVASIILIAVSAGAVYFVGEKYIAHAYVANGVRAVQQEGDLEKSLDHLQRAINTKSNDDFVLRVASESLVLRMAQIASADDIEPELAGEQFQRVMSQAIAVSREATEVNPLNRENWMQLGQVYEEVVGIAEEAEEHALEAYREAIERDPKNPFIHLSKGRVHLKSARVISMQMEQGADMGMTNGEGIVGFEALHNQRLNDALTSFERAMELKGDYIPAQFMLAQVYAETGEFERAVEEAESVLAATPRDFNAAYRLGLILYEQGNYERASDVLERSVALADGVFANARYFWGMALYELDQVDEAIEQFVIIAEDNPENQLVEGILENLRAGDSPLEGLDDPRDVPAEPVPQETDGGMDDPLVP